MGEGPVRLADGTFTDAATAMRDNGIEPVQLAEKEGLALINGTDGMLGMLVLAIDDLHLLDAPSAGALEFALRRLRAEPIAAPTSTPCVQSRASSTNGTSDARRPPKTMAEIGTPCASSACGE